MKLLVVVYFNVTWRTDEATSQQHTAGTHKTSNKCNIELGLSLMTESDQCDKAIFHNSDNGCRQY